MENKDLKTWLSLHDNNAEVKCYVKIGDEEIASPNMATILRDEIFAWQDRLDDVDYVSDNEQNMINLFELIDEFLDELESRLQLSSEFIKEIQETEAGDYSDFVEISPKEFEVSFWDRVDNFARATKIREYVDATNSILLYAKSRLPDLNIYIEGPYLYITQKENASISTSIIAVALDIEAKDIDDRQWEQSIYRIKLEER